MPLKHLTETILVIALAVVIVVTGIFIPTLPHLPQGTLPWLILLALALAYPLSLYGMLKRNRADYAFRFLHFVPAILVCIWLVLELLIFRVPAVRAVLRLYLFGWTLAGVGLAFILLAAFILDVIRRRETRLTALAILFLVFFFFATFNERKPGAPNQLAAVIWQGNWWDISGSEMAEVSSPSSSVGGQANSTSSRKIAMVTSSSAPFVAVPSSSSSSRQQSSSVPASSSRASSVPLSSSSSRLSSRMAAVPSSSKASSVPASSSKSSTQPFSSSARSIPVSSRSSTARSSVKSSNASSTLIASAGRSSSISPFAQGSSSSRPSRLPSAGSELSLLAVTLVGLYSGTLHRRASKRQIS